MSDIITLADYRPAIPRLVHSIELPRAPRPGLSCGDFVRIIATQETGWISRQIETARGLVLEVRISGIAYRVSASACESMGVA